MNHKNGEKPDSLDDRTATSTPHKLRPKRPMSDSSPQQNKPCKPTTKRVRIDEAFTNPWRCESEPYDPLPITYHKPIYNPPCYFSEDLNHLTKSEQALKIMSYHYALSVQMSLCARSQPQHVLLGDPVQGSQLFNGTLEKMKPNLNQSSTSSDSMADKDDMYVSRSGRHVKRRQNFNMFEVFDEDEIEKEKNCKKAKLEKSYKEETPKSTPVAKRTNKKISNEEIMSRSSLFADSPVLNKSPRTQAMFSKLEQTEKENKKAEIEKRKFELSLEQNSDDDLELITSSLESPKAVESSEDDFVRKRIPPPVLHKKGKSLVNKLSEMPSTSTSSASNRDEFANGPKNSGTSAKSINGGSAGSSSSASSAANKRGPKKKMTCCPICGESFSTKEIEEHASTCGLTSELEIESSIPNQRGDTARY